MIVHLRNILSLNDRYAFALLGRFRKLLYLLFNKFLNSQIKSVHKKLSTKTNSVKECLINTLPEVSKEDLLIVLGDTKKQQIISQANKILTKNFNILSKDVKFDTQIDWHLDFNSGYRWSKGKLYTKYTQVDVKTNADVKFPRELSRCHHFLSLGEAYILTENDEYTKEFIEEIRHWIAENPYKKSINWGCSMDIAIRASNWIYSLRMFIKSPLVDESFLHEIFSSLYLHGRFIYENPEKTRANNHNHYLSDLAGQILIGLLFKNEEIEETNLWQKHGIYEFFKEIRSQILPTGFTYERATNYHRLVTELIAYTIIALKNNEIEIPQDILFRIKKMFESILYYLFSNGTAPIIGDQDNGRYLPFYQYNINFQKYLLNIGAILFDDGVFKNYSGTNNIDALFLFGNKGIQKFKKIKSQQKKLESKSFSDAGFYILRSNNVYVFINNSGLSHYNEIKGGTHTHSDLLSFVYAYNNIPFLIDPGTYVYSSNPKERLKFRSTYMHNTLTVDDFSQNELNENDLWYIQRDAIPKEVLWISNNQEDVYEGMHTGYQRLKDSVKHSRRFELNKNNDILTIVDSLESREEHEIKCHFHFDENVQIKIKNKAVYCESKKEHIKISFKVDVEYFLEFKEEYISKAYNKKTFAPYVTINFKSINTKELQTVIEKINTDEANF